jgi:hypothetical protein
MVYPPLKSNTTHAPRSLTFETLETLFDSLKNEPAAPSWWGAYAYVQRIGGKCCAAERYEDAVYCYYVAALMAFNGGPVSPRMAARVEAIARSFAVEAE